MAKETKNINSSTKWIVLVFALILITSIFMTELMAANNKKLEAIDVNKYISEIVSAGEKLVLLTKNNCSKCDDIKQTLENIKLKENMNVYSINIDELSEADLNQLLASSNLIDKNNLPAVLHISAGEVIGTYTGSAKYDDIINFTFIFKQITVDRYIKLVKEDVEHFIYIGRPTCSFCVQSLPWSKRISHDLNKDIYYINIDEETPDSLSLLTETTNQIYEGSTPLFLVTKSNKIIRYMAGAESYTVLNSFFSGTDQKQNQ